MFHRRGETEDIIYDDLPVGVYRVDPQGVFKYCNREARSILGIAEKLVSLSSLRITDFYADSSERTRLLGAMEKNAGRLLNTTIQLRVNGTSKFVLDNCVFDGETHDRRCEVLGVLSDITPSAEYQYLMQRLPIGVYEVDGENTIVRANQATADILGYQKPADLLRVQIAQHYRDPDDLAEFARDVVKHKRVSNRILDMRTADGRDVSLQVSSVLLDPDLGRNGRFGVLTDVTRSQRVARALSKLPTGYYEVQGNGKDAMISDCNASFAHMFGYDGPKELIDRVRAFDLHADEAEWEKYQKSLRLADAQGIALDNYTLHVKRKDKSCFWVSIDCSYDKDVYGNILGREGTVRDVTREVELGHTVEALQEKLQKLTHDVDVLVHRYVSPTKRIEMGLQAQQDMLEATRRGASDSARTGTLTSVWAEKLEGALADGLRSVNVKEGSFIERTLSKIRNELTHRKFRGRQVLEDIETREAALAALDAVSRERRIQNYPAIRNLRGIATSIIDDALIRNSLRLLAQADELYSAIESMRSHLSRVDSVFDFVSMDLVTMVDTLLDLYASYASEKGLSFYYEGPVSLSVVAAEGHMRRAISNLILNAIKYSYRRPEGYINVRIKDELTQVSVVIENYGVPITRDEIETGNILKYGVRGEYSKDHNRMGSGVGLADVAYTIEQHGGGIRIQSSPSRRGADPEDYSLPFVTSVEIWIPGQREEEA